MTGGGALVILILTATLSRAARAVGIRPGRVPASGWRAGRARTGVEEAGMGAIGSVQAEMQVYGPDGHLVGIIDGLPGSRLQVAGRSMIPLSMVIRSAPGRVYLAEAARQYLVTPSLTPGMAWSAEQWRTGARSPGRR